MGKPISINPKDFTEGGYWDNVELEIKSVKCIVYDYENKEGVSKGSGPGAMIRFSDGSDEREQFYSAGSPDAFTPSEDGKYFEQVGTRTTLSKGSDLGKLLISLLNGGFPENQFNNEDYTCLVGTFFLCVQTSAPTDTKKDRTILLAEKVVSLPGAKKGKGKKEASPEATQEASDVIIATLAANPDGVPKNKLPKLIKEFVADSGNRAAVIKLIMDDAFLSGSADWSYEDGILTI